MPSNTAAKAVLIPNELHKELRILAAIRGVKIIDITTAALTLALSDVPKLDEQVSAAQLEDLNEPEVEA